MPNNNPDVWAQIWAFLTLHVSNNDKLICGVAIAFFTSITKSFLYGKTDTPRRIAAEAVLCAIISGSLHPVLVHFNLERDLLAPLGAALSLIGTSAIRQIILRIVNSKFGGGNAN